MDIVLGVHRQGHEPHGAEERPSLADDAPEQHHRPTAVHAPPAVHEDAAPTLHPRRQRRARRRPRRRGDVEMPVVPSCQGDGLHAPQKQFLRRALGVALRTEGDDLLLYAQSGPAPTSAAGVRRMTEEEAEGSSAGGEEALPATDRRAERVTNESNEV